MAGSKLTAAESLRLIHAFEKISDNKVRDALIAFAESYAAIPIGNDNSDNPEDTTNGPSTSEAS